MVYETAMGFSGKHVADAADTLPEPLDARASFGGAKLFSLARSLRYGKNTCFHYTSE
jgi:hypothetical protein